MSASIWQAEAAISANNSVRFQPFVATANQTLFEIPPEAFSYVPGTSSLLVFQSSGAQRPGIDFVETSSSSFTMTTPVAEGTIVLAMAFVLVSSTLDAAQLRDDLANAGDPGKGAALVGFTQTGTGSIPRTVYSKLYESISVKDKGAVGDGVADDTAAIQAAIDSVAGGLLVLIPAGTYKVTSTIYLRRNKVRLLGQGPGVSKIKYVNASGGVVFSGDANTYNSLNTYTSCALADFEVISSGAAATDASIVVDLTSFSYSYFNIEAQTKRNGAAIYYGQGNSGASPYFNHIESTGLFGGTDSGLAYTQEAFRFAGGSFVGGSNGPNANMIGPITRAAGLLSVVNMAVGQGNMFSNLTAESVVGTYFLLGSGTAVDTGTSTGANGQVTFKDTGKLWVTNTYANGAVQITAGTGAGQVRVIKSNTATQLTVNEPWSTIPDATSQYKIVEGKVNGNKFVNIRGEGLSSANPNFIYAYPGVDLTEFKNVNISSLGSGQYLVDYTGSPRNFFYSGDRVIHSHTFTTPGAGANISAYPRTGAFGGVKLGGNYAIEWVKVSMQYFSNADSATITLDAGGSATGNGTQTLAVGIPNGNDEGAYIPAGIKPSFDGTNTSLFLNLQTGGAFSGSYSVTVSWCVTQF